MTETNMRMTVGFNSRPSTGKTTVCRILVEKYGFHAASIGGVLRGALTGMGYDLILFTDPILKEQPREDMFGKSPRGMMLELGAWGRSIHPEYWLRLMTKGIPTDAKGVVFEDVGNEVEADFVRVYLRGPIVQLTRWSAVDSDDGRSVLIPDAVVSNNGDPEEAAARVVEFAEFWRMMPGVTGRNSMQMP